MAAYRCSICNVNWPMVREYRLCPSCRAATWHSTGVPIDEDEARSIDLHAQFERFYDQRPALEHSFPNEVTT